MTTKRQRIEQLEAQLRDKDRKIASLEDQINRYQINFELMQTLCDSTPDDCTPGEYCKACDFAKVYYFYSRYNMKLEPVYLCNKAGSCKHFIQKEQQK